MKRKKILILPAIDDHISIINLAQSKGYEVITCDNMPSNRGHLFADKNYNIDLLDYDALIEMAKCESIDAVWGYSTDIGALAAAKISDALYLNSNSSEVVDTMYDKSKFRSFLKENHFNFPQFITASVVDDLCVDNIQFPVVVKPVDRASSKGISVVNQFSDLPLAFEKAKSASLGGNVIVEEYVMTQNCQLHGDVVIYEGKIVLFAIGDQYFSLQNPTAPIGTVFPSKHQESILCQLRDEVQRFVAIIGFVHGGINVEARVDNEGKVFIIELGPRSGGNYIPELISHYTGVDVKDLLLSCILGQKPDVVLSIIPKIVFQFIWRSSYDGKLLNKTISSELEILNQFVFKTEGDCVSAVAGADNIVAILIIKAKSRQQVEHVFANPEHYFTLSVL